MLLALLTTLAPALATDTPHWDSSFRAAGTNGAVRALLEFDDGSGAQLYLGGHFTLAEDVECRHIARWDGNAFHALGEGLDGPAASLTTFDFGSGAQLVVGGAFEFAGGVVANSVAVWDGHAWTALGAGFDGAVLALCAFDDGQGPKLYAGGAFSHTGATVARGLARWEGNAWVEVGGGTNAPVDALCVHDDGSGPGLFVGGEFTLAGSLSANYIARWSAAGWNTLGAGVSSAVLVLLPWTDASGSRLCVGGDFALAGGLTVDHIATWDGLSWSSVGGGLPQLRVGALAIHVEGSQSALCAGTNGAQAVVRWDGVAWRNVTAPPYAERLWPTLALCSFDDDGSGAPKLFAGGAFSYGGASASIGIDRWNGTAWIGVGADRGVGTSRDEVRALDVFDSGSGPELVVAGRLDDFGGGVLRRNGATFEPLPFTSSYVLDMATHDDGGGPALFVSQWNGEIARWSGGVSQLIGLATLPGGGPIAPERLVVLDLPTGRELWCAGRFDRIDGVPMARVARWDGIAWSPLGSGLGDDTAINQRVQDLCVFEAQGAPRVFAAGNFDQSYFAGRWQVAWWDGLHWVPLPNLPQVAYDLEVYDDGNGPALYAAGGNDGSIYAPFVSYVSRWNGTSWEQIGLTTNTSGAVRKLHGFDDGEGRALYAGGVFTSISGVSALGLARWSSSGWSAVGSGLQTPNGLDALPAIVNTFLEHDFGDGTGPSLLVAGRFIAEGTNSHGIARWVGTRITSFCAGDGLDAQQTTPCPCDNFGSAGRGCAWSNGPLGAELHTNGAIAPEDTLVLEASGMSPSATGTVFWKSDLRSDAAVVWGDGLRCLDGNLLRLGTRVNVNGAASYPGPTNPPLSVRGQTPVGSGLVGHYQTTFRNAASYCTPQTFNATNGVRVIW